MSTSTIARNEKLSTVLVSLVRPSMITTRFGKGTTTYNEDGVEVILDSKRVFVSRNDRPELFDEVAKSGRKTLRFPLTPQAQLAFGF